MFILPHKQIVMNNERRSKRYIKQLQRTIINHYHSQLSDSIKHNHKTYKTQHSIIPQFKRQLVPRSVQDAIVQNTTQIA